MRGPPRRVQGLLDSLRDYLTTFCGGTKLDDLCKNAEVTFALCTMVIVMLAQLADLNGMMEKMRPASISTMDIRPEMLTTVSLWQRRFASN